jgi:UDP-N-acetylmuramoylalanine--D-glutamate ligase
VANDTQTFDLANKRAVVLGLGPCGRAASAFLRRSAARVTALDSDDTAELRAATAELRALGVEVGLGVTEIPAGEFDFGVVSPELTAHSPLLLSAANRNLHLLSELELGAQRAHCLTLAIAGTNGKSTTAALVERMFVNNHRQALVCGPSARPVCSAVEQTKALDFLVLQTSAFQLEWTHGFHPVVAVLLNLAADYVERYPNPDDYARACARVFRQQQAFDWAIIQSEALARLRALNLEVPSKIITFSATDTQADLHLDRSLLISRLPNWPGPLLNLEHCQLRGPHHAENLMAALAVGHVLRLPLEDMVDPLKTFTAGAHRGQLVAELNGVQFIDDSKALNLDALHKALLAARSGPTDGPNVWLIAGGQDRGLDFHDLGPVLSQRVKRAFLVGEAAEKIRAAWSLFTPCTLAASLVEAVAEAARSAVSGDVVLLSPACSSLDQFQDYQHRGECFCRAVKSIGWGAHAETPKIVIEQ